MVTKETYRDLLFVVNDAKSNDALKKYASERIEFHRSQLEQAQDMETVRSHQGAISALRKILTLRDEVISGAK